MIREPVAVVGIGLRLPGAECPSELWELLRAGIDATSSSPDLDQRWRAPALAALPSARAGLLADVEGADAAALRLLKRELRQMDPQHRILLECAWRALEDAGVELDSKAETGRRAGVWVGVNFGDWARLLGRDWARLDGYSLLGSSAAFAANRISHAFDLRGPSVVVNSGCASSSLAIHDACRALALGEVELALAGGVELLLSPDASLMLAEAGVLSRHERCRTLDADADGYVRGEGAGLLVLKPVAKLEPGDRVHAIIRATAANHNGRNQWIMAADEQAQREVITEACRVAGVEPASVDYVEMHGSSLAGGDAIEARAIAGALRAATDAGTTTPCRIGALSNNLGYLGPASGVASVIKVCLALRERELLPTIHVAEQNPAVDGATLTIQRRREPWPEPSAGPRRAGVISTSLGGANAFVLLEEAPCAASPAAPPSTEPQLLLVSGHTLAVLERRIADLAAWLRAHELPLDRVCASAARCRQHRHRVALIAGDRAQMLAALERCRSSLAAGEGPGQTPWTAEVGERPPASLVDDALAWLRGGLVPTQGRATPMVELPPYPFARERLWPDWLSPELISGSPAAGVDEPAPRSSRPPSRVLTAGDDLDGFLRAQLAELLELDPRQIDTRERSLFELGLTSLGAVELGKRITAALGIEVPAIAVFERPHVEALVAWLRGREAEPAGTVESPRPGFARAELDDDAIAIVGLGCRLPGGIDSPERFAELLFAGRTAITELPDERRALLGEAAASLLAARPGGFVADVERFDAEFFRITRREAEGVDPQQRVFLEVAWEALERAGIAPSSLSGSRTGVFAGVHARDYASLAEAFGRTAAEVGPHWSTGVDASYVAGRLAYVLGLEGPCMAVDTACSSSLAAVHLACQSLRSGESTLAIAGGVKLSLAPQLSVFLREAGAMSPSGRCRAFDADADGMVQGEGCGVVILERLGDARRAGHPVLACIRASVINHDGASGGLTVPSVQAQARLYARAVAEAEIADDELDYLEAHGTGTTLGDPIELEGVARVYARPTRARPLWVGSVKANLGHAEAAAGVIGLIKSVLVLERGAVPPTPGFERPTPAFAWDRAALSVARAAEPLAQLERPRRAAVSSFGMSGVNVHAIVEQPPSAATTVAEASAPESGEGPWLLCLSARDDAALRALARAHERALASEVELADYCFTALAGRTHFRRRAALVADSREALREQLRAVSVGVDVDGIDDAARASREAALEAAGDRRAQIEAMAALYLAGGELEPRRAYPQARRSPRLPTYPWQRQRYWWDGVLDAPELPASRLAAAPTWCLGWTASEAAGASALGRMAIVDARGERASALLDLIEAADGEAQFARADAIPEAVDAVVVRFDGEAPRDAADVHAWIRDRALELIAVVRALAEREAGPRLVMVTRGACQVRASERPAIAEAALWGLARVIAYEHPRLRCRRIDLDPEANELAALQDLVDALADADAPDELALRDGGRLVSRFCPGPELTDARACFDPQRSYVITGGLGGVGLELAAWMIERGAKRLALLGRSRPSNAQQARIDALSRAGARVSSQRVDVGDRNALTELVGVITAELGPIAGVVHAAGVLDDKLATELDAASFDRVLRAKVDGALNLHALFGEPEILEHFVLISSTAGSLGAPGQGNYAAANALLDALAQRRRADGLPGLAIAWGPWAEVGMAAADERRGPRLAERGLRPMAPSAALAPLDALLSSGNAAASVAIAELDVDRWIAAHPAVRDATRLRSLSTTAPSIDAEPEPELQVQGTRDRAGLEHTLLGLLSEVSRIPRARLAAEDPLAVVGLDSLMALELRDLIVNALGIELPLSAFVDEASIASLAGLLADKLALLDKLVSLDEPDSAATAESSPKTKEVLL